MYLVSFSLVLSAASSVRADLVGHCINVHTFFYKTFHAVQISQARSQMKFRGSSTLAHQKFGQVSMTSQSRNGWLRQL